MEYEAVIGLEVHAQLLTKTKIFCGCPTDFGAEPNSQACPVCLGMPGALPVLNQEAVTFAVKAGLATNCAIREYGRFARKNYFYPDLPKGYQISQYDEPLCADGYVDIEVEQGEQAYEKRIGLIRIHLEEDAGKSMHTEGASGDSQVDVNRCGVPLIEIVSQPDIRSAREAHIYLARLRQILLYLNVCDGNMEEGSLRCDANVSIRPKGATTLGTRTEIKNLNSFRNVERAIEYEIQRQTELVISGGVVEQQTMLWDADRNVALPMRGKEDSHDYRYFPDPDLVPLVISQSRVAEVRQTLPEMPAARRARLESDYGIPRYDATVLTTGRELADYYEDTVKLHPDGKLVSNWMMGEVLRILNDQNIGIQQFPVKPAHLAELFDLMKKEVISGKIAKTVFSEMVQTGKNPTDIVQEKGLVQITDSAAIEGIVDKVLHENPKHVEQYRAGKTGVLGFLVGQIMKSTQGKANPTLVNQLLKARLDAPV